MPDMRIVVVTNDSLFAAASLRRFAAEQASNVVAVVITPTLPGAKSNRQGMSAMLATSGTGYVALKAWVNVATPLLGKALGGVPSLTGLLREAGCVAPVRVVKRADAPEVVAWLRELAPDVLLSAGATHKFNDELLAVPSHCAVNMHPSLLPKYAGTDPYFWCLRNGDEESGVTLHVTSSKLDAGPIVAQRRIPLASCRSVLDLMVRMWSANDEMIADFFAGGADVTHAVPQGEGRTFYKRPTKQDIRALRAQGRGLADLRSIVKAVAIARACRVSSSDRTGREQERVLE